MPRHMYSNYDAYCHIIRCFETSPLTALFNFSLDALLEYSLDHQFTPTNLS